MEDLGKYSIFHNIQSFFPYWFECLIMTVINIFQPYTVRGLSCFWLDDDLIELSAAKCVFVFFFWLYLMIGFRQIFYLVRKYSSLLYNNLLFSNRYLVNFFFLQNRIWNEWFAWKGLFSIFINNLIWWMSVKSAIFSFIELLASIRRTAWDFLLGSTWCTNTMYFHLFYYMPNA